MGILKDLKDFLSSAFPKERRLEGDFPHVEGKKRVHLICNSHIDPVWLWEWQEGAAEALSTFRTAANLCEEFHGFVFNHNEAILYKWVEEYDPLLFQKIQRLVKAKQWHIMGGWHLQPDCNMPAGESFVRQILLGKLYFREKFGVSPATAINFDPFGHNRGLVQILAKSGYDSYLFCRPHQKESSVPAPEFVWVGYDGSEVLAARPAGFYNSAPGQARRKAEEWIRAHPDKQCSAVLWGVGNHGGGPSREDLGSLARLMQERPETAIFHSTPEAYFEDLRRVGAKLPRHEFDLNPWAVGCYTSMSRVKKRHRTLENEFYTTEKMAASAAFQNLIAYPQGELNEALCDLLTSEFHDILPGSSIQPVEEAALRCMDHGLEILSRVKARAFFALASGQRMAGKNEIPVLVYNPHPQRMKAVVECEIQPAAPNKTNSFLWPKVFFQNVQVPSQVEKEHCNINEDFRKRVVFSALLEPSQMNRFDCCFDLTPKRAKPSLRERKGKFLFKAKGLEVIINARTGFVDRYRVGGVEVLGRDACRPIVMQDYPDPWGMRVTRFRKLAGKFKLMPRTEGTRFSGVSTGTIPSVRVIEDGPVRSVVEAVFSYGDSFICQKYKLPKESTEIEVEVRVLWNEKDKMLKLSIPTRIPDAEYLGQTAYGTAALKANGDEVVAQKWVAVVSRSRNRALTCINDGTYGSDMARGELRLSLLRSPAYAGHPVENLPILVQDRYTPRIDQGEHLFRFWLNAGSVAGRLEQVDREALWKNESPFALVFFPNGQNPLPKPFVTLSDETVQVTAMKKAEGSHDLILRVFEPTGKKRTATLSLPFVPATTEVTLKGSEIKTVRFNRNSRRFTEVNLLEEVR